MAVGGLLALLEDVTSTLDDISTLEQLAVEKSAKIAEDDLTGNVRRGRKIDPRHEISVIMAVAKGSLKNKVLFFIPTTFAIATLAPWAVVPLSVASGIYISYEGTKKFLERTDPARAARRRAALRQASGGGKETLLRYEKERISQAVKTDAALSLELAGVHIGMATGAPLLTKLAILTAAGIGTTTVIYAAIIGIIKVDDIALHLAHKEGDSLLAKAQRKTGRGLLRGAGPVMKGLTGIGMTALFYLGGHLLAENVPVLHEAVEHVGHALSHVGIFKSAAEVTTMIATGVASGFAAVGVMAVVEKPALFVSRQLEKTYNAALAKPVNAVKKAFKRGLDKVLRRDKVSSGLPTVQEKTPEAKPAAPQTLTIPNATIIVPPAEQPQSPAKLPENGKLAQDFAKKTGNAPKTVQDKKKTTAPKTPKP
jgi:predicted DNA repair protein MutK